QRLDGGGAQADEEAGRAPVPARGATSRVYSPVTKLRQSPPRRALLRPAAKSATLASSGAARASAESVWVSGRAVDAGRWTGLPGAEVGCAAVLKRLVKYL